jgi:transketolase
MAYYSVLFEFKKISRNYINNYLQTKSKLWGHVTRMKHKNFKFSFGSLGYGPGIAAGLALGYKLKSNNNTIFCIISDGELNEGSIWESLSFISHHKLKNIIILLDKNNIQSFGFTKKIIFYPNLKKVFSSLGFYTTEVDGHNVSKIYELIVKKKNKPKVIICNTIKGKGIPEIQNKLSSHYIPATIEQTKIYEK